MGGSRFLYQWRSVQLHQFYPIYSHTWDVLFNWISFNDTTGATDSHGNPVSDALLATGITYDLCVQACGAGGGPFSWSQFSQQFSAWLLPWLALFSQFPFGNRLKYDNIMSVVIALGSPCLAAYSLTLTVLNNYWVARRFAKSPYPNCRYAVIVLSSLQQSALKVAADANLLASLVVLPENDLWWRELAEWLDYADTHTWSIGGATSIVWVIVAYVLTLVDAINVVSTDPNGNGQGLSGVGSLWLWTLPVCLGYLQLSPRCDAKRLSNALNRANNVAYVAGTNGAVKADQVDSRRALSFNRSRDGELYHDQEATAPIYNYARFLSYGQAVEEVACAFQNAADKASLHRPVNPDVVWQSRTLDFEIHPANRTGSAGKVAAYCRPRTSVRKSRWGPGVFSRCFIASVAALVLQWTTSGASIIIVYYTQVFDTRIGCRSAAYLLYAGTATFIWMLFVATSLIGHYATADIKAPDFSQRVAARVAVFLRRLAKFLATCNAVFIITAFILQFGNFYDRCYCDANVLGLGKHRGYSEMVLTASDLSVTKTAWIGGVSLAFTGSGLFLAFINTFMNPPLPPQNAP
ncbi:hypothetical protein C8R44DRAFT_906372 [Mycena epipterygia]|nr:hypothetical protein C8R44DRAFT_906372 [Mycena epipterygia]